MQRAEKIQKNFSKSYLEVLEQARVMHAFFVVDLTSFTARFPFMDSSYATAFLAAIDDADAQPDDETVVDMQQMVTTQLEQNMQLARNAYTTLMTYVELAFPGRADVYELFGKKKYETARKNQLKLKELLELAHSIAQKPEYNPAIVAKGFTQPEIDQLALISETLETTNVEQEIAKGERLTSAQMRVVKYNAVFAYMQEISKTSKVVFADNYAKQQQYLLYNEGSNETELAVFEGTLAASEKLVLGSVANNVKTVKMEVVNTSIVDFGFTTNGTTFSGAVRTVSGNIAVFEPVSYFGTISAGTQFLAKNISASDSAQYKVTFLG